MRFKMRSFVSYLMLVIGVFVLGDMLLFNNVGHHQHQDPYRTGNSQNRQIKSRRDYPDVRQSLMGALDIPGMGNKRFDHSEDDDEMTKVRALERSLLDGDLIEEDVADDLVDDDHAGDRDLESAATAEQLDSQTNTQVSKSSSQGLGSRFRSFWSFGDPKSSHPEPDPFLKESELARYEASKSNQYEADESDSLNVPGFDDSVLTKLKAGSSGETTKDSNDNNLFSQLKGIRNMAESAPDWARLDRAAPDEPAPLSSPTKSPISVKQLQNGPGQGKTSALSFISGLFQFAGTTGDDDKDDAGWASVGEVESPKGKSSDLTVDSTLAEALDTLPDFMRDKLEPAQPGPEVPSMVAVPGFGDSFFKKYGKVDAVSDEFPVKEAPAQPPPAAVNQGDQVQVIPSELDQSAAGLSDDFFNKIYQEQEIPTDDNLAQLLDTPREQPATDTREEQQGSILVPNIPGLSSDFFNKYGGAKLPETEHYRPSESVEYTDGKQVSLEFFNQFIHPVAKGSAAMPSFKDSVAESLEDVRGLPDGFLEKYLKPHTNRTTQLLSGAGLGDIPALSGYLDKYKQGMDIQLSKGPVSESVQVPSSDQQQQQQGFQPEGIPELPGVQDSQADSGFGLLGALLGAFVGKKETATTEEQPSLLDMLPDLNVSTATETSRTPQEEGFQVKQALDSLEAQEMLRVLMPQLNETLNNTGLMVDPSDALGLLNKLQGVVEPIQANLSEELASITALEDSRVVSCNLTKSPDWKVAITDRWHTVKDGLMFVYSSYLDDRIPGHTAIRVLGILEGWEVGMHLKPFCQIWFQDKDHPYVIGATYEWLPGQPIAKFKAVLLTCVYQTNHVDGRPLAIALTTEPCEPPQFLVKIHTRNETVGIKKTDFTVCLTGPMKFGYADVGQFIQWMEFNILMGVERFVLYNHSMDATLRPYLIHYAKLGYVQLFPWVIPDNIPNPLVFLKNLGHLAMINDCMYRNMWTSRRVIFMDIDEMIVPRKGDAMFGEMLKNTGCDVQPQAVIQSVFFRREWPSDDLYTTNETIVNMGLVGLLKTKRDRKIWPPYMRSKYFIKPDEVLISNVHAAHSFLSPLGYQELSCIVNPKEVLLHHYRYWGEITSNYVVDRRLHDYGDTLLRRAASVYEAVLGRKVT